VTGDFLQEVSQKTIEKLFSGRSRVTAAASTSSKVKGLTLATREQYLSKIIEVLHDNYKGCVEEEDQTMDKKDVQDCAVEMEYSVFTTNTTMTMYRNGVAKMVCLIFFVLRLFCNLGNESCSPTAQVNERFSFKLIKASY
jgi:hypothetical protein